MGCILTGTVGSFAYGTVLIDGVDYGHGNNGAKVIWDLRIAGYTNGSIILLQTLAAGSHTIGFRTNVDNVNLVLGNYQAVLQVFQLGG